MKIKYIKHGKYLLPVIVFLCIGCMVYTLWSLGRQAAATANTVRTADRLPVYRTDNDENKIALTINCAWGADDIPGILETLDRAGIKATFFVVGTWAEKYPDMLQLIYSKGHEIGNHSYSHKLPSKNTEAVILEEIRKCNSVVKGLLDIEMDLYRAPSGDHTDTLMKLTAREGMMAIKWSVDSLDWMDTMSAADIVNRVTGKIHSGAIILCHNDTKHTAEVLPEIISHLQSEKYQFVTVSELIYKDNYRIDNQGKQIKD